MQRSSTFSRPSWQCQALRQGRIVFAVLPLVAAWPALASELTQGGSSGLGAGTRVDLGPVQATISGALRVGTEIRLDDAHYTSAADSMSTLNDGTLNYAKGDTFSRSLEAYLQADLRYQDAGLFVSTKAWYDQALKRGNVLHGNSVNGYAAGAPLSDRGFVPLGRFANVVLDDAYVYNTFHFGDQQSLLLRLGNQVIPWVTPTSISGGIQQVNAFDYAAQARTTSIAEAQSIPAPALYAKFKLSPALTLDGYYQFGFEPNAYPSCGTFFSTSDYAQQGCTKLTLNGAVLSALTGKAVVTTDAQAAANPLDFVSRGPENKPKHGQYGLSANYLVDGVGLFGVYLANTTSRQAVTAVVRTGPGVLTPALANVGKAVPTGIAAYYERLFPTDIHMLGLNFKTRLPDGTGIYSELTYRPNQPLAWNGSDFIAGVLSGKGPLGRLASTAVGTTALGYDTFKVTQFNVGGSRPMGTWQGGELSLSAEAALKHVAGLPDPSVMRYGRVGWGVAPSTTAPTCTADAKTCAYDGFVTTTAWGLRMKLEDKFTGVADGLDLTPSLALAYDAHGYAYDGVFSQGRTTAVFELRGTFRKSWTLGLSYLKTGGGHYNVSDDRSFVALNAGAKF